MIKVKAIIPRRRLVTKKGNLIEIIAQKTPKSEDYPEGIKYSFSLIHKNQRIIAFDNFSKEGHHKHYFNAKEPYKFESLEITSNQFFELVEKFEKPAEEKNDSPRPEGRGIVRAKLE